MATDYSTLLKNARLDLVNDYINAGAGAGYIEIATTGHALVLATITLADPAAPAAAAGVLTMTMPQSDSSADNTGTAAEAKIFDSDSLEVVGGLTVGIAATDIILDSTAITQLQTVTINTATITHG
jgi:hypothetical protein